MKDDFAWKELSVSDNHVRFEAVYPPHLAIAFFKVMYLAPRKVLLLLRARTDEDFDRLWDALSFLQALGDYSADRETKTIGFIKTSKTNKTPLLAYINRCEECVPAFAPIATRTRQWLHLPADEKVVPHWLVTKLENEDGNCLSLTCTSSDGLVRVARLFTSEDECTVTLIADVPWKFITLHEHMGTSLDYTVDEDKNAVFITRDRDNLVDIEEFLGLAVEQDPGLRYASQFIQDELNWNRDAFSLGDSDDFWADRSSSETSESGSENGSAEQVIELAFVEAQPMDSRSARSSRP